MSVIDDQSIFKSSKCNKNHNKDFNKDLINRFASTYKFCDSEIIDMQKKCLKNLKLLI